MKEENAVSQTAMMIASLRALNCYEEDLLIRGNDNMADLFLPEDKRLSLKSSDLRKEIKKMIPSGLYEYVIARTKHFDGLILKVLEEKITQIVILGAGYDTRAYRFADKMGSAKIFEVDAAATQKAKVQILEDHKVYVPANTVYVKADFEQKDWFQSLYSAGYQNSERTLFIWEGVTFYLSPGSVESTLRTINENSLGGSIISFDYQHIDAQNGLIDIAIENEKVKFGINAEACEEYLSSLGFCVIEKLNSSDLSAKYLTMENGNRYGEIKEIMNIVVAKVQ